MNQTRAQSHHQHDESLGQANQEAALDGAPGQRAVGLFILVINQDPGNRTAHAEINERDVAGNLEGKRPETEFRLAQIFQCQRH